MRPPRRFRSYLVALALIAACRTTAAAGDHPEPSAEAHRVAMSEIRDKAGSMPIDLRKDIDKRIAATVDRVNRDVATLGHAKLEAKAADALGITVESLIAVKVHRGFSWGELVVAQTLLSDSKQPLTLDDLGSLREEGWSWGALAYALGFHLEDLEDEIRTKGKIGS